MKVVEGELDLNILEGKGGGFSSGIFSELQGVIVDHIKNEC